MPIYDYQCSACGHQLEAIQKFSDAPRIDCPACNAPELKKQVSMPSFRLSGSGWYETDFKTGAKKNLASGDSSDNSGKADKTAAPAPAAKPEKAAVSAKAD